METELPEGLRSDIRRAVTPMLEAARRAGWSFSSIRSKAGSHMIELNAISPSGTAVHGSWGEDEFSERLKVVLDYGDQRPMA
jgi:hypothetical protein